MSDSSTINNASMEAGASAQSFSANEAFLDMHPWVRYYESGVSAHLTLPDQPLTWLLEKVASRYPNNTAFDYYGSKLTYAQFSVYANRFAFALRRLGVQKGDRVAIALPNIPQYPIAFYGALLAGAVVVPTNPLYTEREMQHQLADSGARVVIVLDIFYPIVRAVRSQTTLEHVIVTSAADFLPPVLRVLYPLEQRRNKHAEPQLSQKELHADKTLHVMRTLLESQREGNAALHFSALADASDLAVLQYTGGTTGLSKGAMLTHRNLLANVMQIRAWFTNLRDGKEVTLCAAPFFHAYGMTAGMNVSMLIAATMVLLPQFKVKEVVKTIRRTHPTLFPGIPTMYLAILHEASKHPEDLGSIKYCISGAAPLAAKLQTDFESITHGKLVEGYGLSEASPVTHCNPLTEQCRNGTIGLPLPDIEAAIVDHETGVPLASGEIGELVVKGPNIMQGYWKREEETKATLRDGWLHTGDLGTMDEDGYFSIVERLKDVIIASGFKVYPREVEEILFQHPYVAEAAVAGIPDEYRGETVAAFVVLKTGVEASEESRHELIRFCEQEMTSYKVPRIMVFRESLPKSLIGKVLRRELSVG
ncbi:MAG TPA: long-chain fatty acid--CoA ligase [Ktedonobacteraceae bacterium]|nr:long-chain fatty acid--CoA ligase [Ktedonobacteraceae bacterium]